MRIMVKMVKIDEKDVKIIKKLIRNPRTSDSKISKETGIAVMTVNRKRRYMEKQGLITYYTDFCHGKKGIRDFYIKQLYIVKLRVGITIDKFLEIDIKGKMMDISPWFITESYVGEMDGRFAWIFVANAESVNEMLETFNGQIIPIIKKQFGETAVINVITCRITDLISMHHNYFPGINMEDGSMKKDWPEERIFVSKKNYSFNDKKTRISDY